MTDLLTLLAFNSLYIFGLWNSADYSLNVDKGYDTGEILGKLGYYAQNLPTWLNKPLIGCVICMASLHSFPYWLIYDFTLFNGCIWILYTFPIHFLNLEKQTASLWLLVLKSLLISVLPIHLDIKAVLFSPVLLVGRGITQD